MEWLKAHPLASMLLTVVAILVGVGLLIRKNAAKSSVTDATTTGVSSPPAQNQTPYIGGAPQFVSTTSTPQITVNTGTSGSGTPPPPTIITVAWNWTYHPTDNESIINLATRVTNNIQSVFHQHGQAYTGNAISKADIIAHNPWLIGYIKNTPSDNLHTGARTIVLPQALAVNTAKRGGGVGHVASGSHPIGSAGALSGHGGRKGFGSKSGVVGPGSHRGSSLDRFHHAVGGGVVGPGGLVGGLLTGSGPIGDHTSAAGSMHLGTNLAGDIHFHNAPPEMDTPQPPLLGMLGWNNTHVVGHGDTIHSIAAMYKKPWYELYHHNRASIDNISYANGNIDGHHWNNLYEGTVLQVP